MSEVPAPYQKIKFVLLVIALFALLVSSSSFVEQETNNNKNVLTSSSRGVDLEPENVLQANRNVTLDESNRPSTRISTRQYGLIFGGSALVILAIVALIHFALVSLFTWATEKSFGEVFAIILEHTGPVYLAFFAIIAVGVFVTWVLDRCNICYFQLPN